MATKKQSAKKQNKYQYWRILQGNYGYGWDDLIYYGPETTSKERKADLKTYQENEKGVPHRFINRRELNPDYKR